MRFDVLATDYDGTLARHGTVEASTVAALERLRESGRRIFLVTGRELEDLKTLFSRFDLFDAVIAENGAVLFHPATGTLKLLHEPPPRRFVEDLRVRGVPVSVGHVIVSSREPHETIILDVIKLLGLELEIIFNKGAVMVLPAGTNKATGLTLALHEAGLLSQKTAGIGDAENDHAFLNMCGCAVAVSNALPSLKEHACFVTSAPYGRGVEELINRMIADDLEGVIPNAAEVRSRDHPRVLPGVRAQTTAAP
jgi:hydroxymethylpyrimidine pyrophosphatase-like HAD family hydrolase